METSPFKAGGLLTEDPAKVYISREADQEAINHLFAMDYLLLVEPRHQGKTSLIHHVKGHLALANIILVYIDVTTPDHSSEEGWYHTFCPRLLRQIPNVIDRDQWPQLPRNSFSWRDFLSEIAAYFAKTNQKVVIALDGIGAVTFPGATEFFTVLRDIYNSRQFETEFKYLTLLLSGAFPPRDLIKDDKISPFNVAQRVRLKDFTLAKVHELVSNGPWPSEQDVFLAKRIHYWTDGQPYLTQLLCTYLGPDALPSDVDAGVERLRREDRNHLPRILQWLNQDKKLLEYVGDVRSGKDIKFYPSEHDRQAQLELLGVLKADEEGNCHIRNRIYELALPLYDSPTSMIPAPTEQGWLPFKLQLARQSKRKFEVRALQTAMGESYATSQLPYNTADLTTILKVLENRGYNTVDFTLAQTKVLQRLGLIRNDQLVPDYLKLIGKGLYDALFPGDVGVAFRMVFNQARHDRKTIFLQLRFDPDAVDLARYPWELLYDGHRHLVSAGAVEMARYITYSEAVPNLPVHPPGRLLFVESRPKDLVTLPSESERLVVWDALQPLNSTGKLKLERLETPTYDALEQRLRSADYHLIHFDGHGLFAKRCPRCQTINSSELATCKNCQTTLEDVAPQGYLIFEDSTGDADFVSTEVMENLLLNSQVRMIFLSACQTGMVGGGTLFGGLGPGLIRAGVPAVVAMQFSVPVQTTIKFAESFYNAIARGETVSRAVAQGRRRLFRENTWFIPTLYLRSQDDEGHIFTD